VFIDGFGYETLVFFFITYWFRVFVGDSLVQKNPFIIGLGLKFIIM
jgi:hypothetical protein